MHLGFDSKFWCPDTACALLSDKTNYSHVGEVTRQGLKEMYLLYRDSMHSKSRNILLVFQSKFALQQAIFELYTIFLRQVN